MILPKFHCELNKGVPARESRTGTWLVSPAAGREKKKIEVSTKGPQTTKLSTLEHILLYTNSIVSGLTSRGTLKHQKPGDIKYPFHIWARGWRNGKY